jgi:hypothetical protein
VRFPRKLLLLAALGAWFAPARAADDAGPAAAIAAPQAEEASAQAAPFDPAVRIEPGLEDRRRRYARSTAGHVAMIPAYVLRFPFQVVNYPLEHWIIHKEPGAVTVYGRRAYSRLQLGGGGARIGGLGSGSGTGGGLYYRLPLGLTFGKPLTVSASVTHRLYEQYAVRLDSLHVGPVPASLSVVYNDRPREDFWGLGPHSSEDARSTYRLEETFGTFTLNPRIHRALSAVAFVGASRSDVSPGRDPDFPDSQDLFDPKLYEGLTGRFEFIEYGAGLVLDRRDAQTYARHGSYASLAVQAADGLGETSNAYTKYALEARQFLPLPGYLRTFAMRFRTVITDNRSSHPIPVFRLESVGSGRTIRGYQTYRFTEEDAILGSAEYRFPVWTIEPPSGIRVDGALFFDFGTVLPELSKLQQRHLRSGGGVGLRIVTPRASIGRMDIAFSPEGVRVHFSIRGAY